MDLLHNASRDQVGPPRRTSSADEEPDEAGARPEDGRSVLQHLDLKVHCWCRCYKFFRYYPHRSQLESLGSGRLHIANPVYLSHLHRSEWVAQECRFESLLESIF